AFVPGHGALLSTVAAWSEDGQPRYCISAGIARPDAAAHLGDGAARESGFDLCIPEAILRTGSVRLFQRYADRTLELAGFQRKVRARLDPQMGPR
ncbi:hypothetical protein ACFQ12_00775, partial [Methylobacterium trifolii]